MNYNFGFGDFTFRLPDNTIVQKATTIDEFIKGIETLMKIQSYITQKATIFQLASRKSRVQFSFYNKVYISK